MPNLKSSRSSSDSEPVAVAKLAMTTIDLSEYPDLLILLQEIKNKFRLTPSDYHMVFADIEVRIASLGLVEFDEEIELLSTLFNLIFNDPELPEDIKIQLARLQINMLISVIREPGFIDRSSNPVRRLLDTVVKTEIDLVQSGNTNRTAAEFLKQEIDKIVNCEIVDFSHYEKLLTLYQEETGTAPKSKTDVKPVDKTEEITRTTQIVLSIMQEFTVPLQVQNKSTMLFDKVWTPLLLRVALTDGVGSSVWIKTVQTIKTQVWALTPKTTSQDHQRLTTMFPHIKSSLARGMSSLKLPTKLQNSLKEYLDLEQTEVLQATENNIKSLAEADQARRREAARIIDVAKDQIKDKEVVKKPGPATNKPMPDSNTKAEVSEAEELHGSIAAELKNGDWIKIKQDDSEIMAKLSWRSDDCSLFIFLDRQGNRVREIDGTTLDYEISTGIITVTDSANLSSPSTSLSYFTTSGS